MGYLEFPVEVPEGKTERVRIDTFTVSPEIARYSNVKMLYDGEYWMRIEPGTYKRLVVDGEMMMSNTPMERYSNDWIIKEGKGRILINGLGLGCVLTALLKKPDVTEVWVVEKDEDVIKLVWPTFEHDPRVRLIHADALEYVPPKGQVFDYVWHDIWPTISVDNLPDMTKLHRRYARRCVHQQSWLREYLQKRKRSESRRDRRYW